MSDKTYLITNQIQTLGTLALLFRKKRLGLQY